MKLLYYPPEVGDDHMASGWVHVPREESMAIFVFYEYKLITHWHLLLSESSKRGVNPDYFLTNILLLLVGD